jgi:virginiamycin B lyase
MTIPTLPAPRPLCAAFAPLLPLISSGALEDNEAAPTREHVASCAWCQQELARYVEVDEALRRGFGAAHEGMPPILFDLDDDGDYAFTLDDTLEETMAAGNDQRDSQSFTTARSSRWDARKRRPTPRVTAIAGIAAALILAIVATTIYTKFATPRTTAPAATTTTGGSFSKVIKLPNPLATIDSLAVAPDGSVWLTETIIHNNKIGRISPDGTLSEFPVETNGNAMFADVSDIVVGPDGNLWFVSGMTLPGLNFAASIIRMTPSGAMTTFPLPQNVGASRLLFGPDGALWFSEGSKLGRMTSDGHLTEYSLLAPEKGQIADMCIGPDGALWYTWLHANHIGRMTLSGQVKDFAVPFSGWHITRGPDDALWYTELDHVPVGPSDFSGRKGFVGHITTDGVVIELPIDANVSANQIITGSDGAMWFDVYPSETITVGRITTTGDVKIISSKESGQVGRFATAPGAIWILDAQNTLWRYRLTA